MLNPRSGYLNNCLFEEASQSFEEQVSFLPWGSTLIKITDLQLWHVASWIQ